MNFKFIISFFFGQMNTIYHNKNFKPRGIYFKSLMKFMYCSILLIVLFNNQFSTALAVNPYNKRENDLRDINFKECPICYDEDIFKLLNNHCDGITTISDLNEMTKNDLLCLCNV